MVVLERDPIGRILASMPLEQLSVHAISSIRRRLVDLCVLRSTAYPSSDELRALFCATILVLARALKDSESGSLAHSEGLRQAREPGAPDSLHA